jgi:hypothetical protein
MESCWSRVLERALIVIRMPGNKRRRVQSAVTRLFYISQQSFRLLDYEVSAAPKYLLLQVCAGPCKGKFYNINPHLLSGFVLFLGGRPLNVVVLGGRPLNVVALAVLE